MNRCNRCGAELPDGVSHTPEECIKVIHEDRELLIARIRAAEELINSLRAQLAAK